MTQPVRGTAWGGAMRLLVEGEQHLAAGLRNGQEAQGFAVEAGRLDLSRVVEAVEQGWHGRLGASGRPLRFQVEGDLPPVRASEAAVLHVLDVLVGNAAEHGSGTVTVRVRAAPGGLAIEVGDEGPGVAGDPEQFFARRAGSADGHGIGLALARSLAEAEAEAEGGRLLLQRPVPAPVFALLLPADRAPEVASASSG